MSRERANTGKDEHGIESHPAFGMARIGRISAAPGEVLFQSDLRHREYIQLTISEATRERNLKDDWVFPGRVVCEVSMSMSQFASMIASGGSEGVPVTINRTDRGERPGLYPQPRLAQTTEEVRKAAEEAFAGIQAAEAAYEDALGRKAPAAERRKALADLRAAVNNAVPNVEYAGKKLAEHAEAVVERSRADVEAMVTAAQKNRAIESTAKELPV